MPSVRNVHHPAGLILSALFAESGIRPIKSKSHSAIRLSSSVNRATELCQQKIGSPKLKSSKTPIGTILNDLPGNQVAPFGCPLNSQKGEHHERSQGNYHYRRFNVFVRLRHAAHTGANKNRQLWPCA
jgi:hypothetical protein